MCNGFGMIISKEIKGYFCEPDSDGDCSHSTILNRLGWKDSKSEHIRGFVRVQCPDWKIDSFEFDEDKSLPGWAEEGKDEIISLVKRALRRAAPAEDEYQRVKAQAWAIISNAAIAQVGVDTSGNVTLSYYSNVWAWLTGQFFVG